MVEVPYWWDQKYESLAATVYSQRPDLFKDTEGNIYMPPVPTGDPIPLVPPSLRSQQNDKTKGF